MGRTGLHIAQKNSNDPQWVWPAFEHVNNVPDKTATSFDDADSHYIPDCDDCAAVNAPPPLPWDPNAVVADGAGKSQMMRVALVTANAASLNAAVQGDLVNGTVWINYRMIPMQCPSCGGKTDPQQDEFENLCSPANPVDLSGAPILAFLANATLGRYSGQCAAGLFYLHQLPSERDRHDRSSQGAAGFR